MIRAALKSLLGRKVRLLMSTFAIVLGVAFVVGTLIFSDTLNRSFTALFASAVGEVVVRPEGSQTSTGTPSARTLPADLVRDLEDVDGVARVDGNVNAFGVYVVGDDGKVVGGLGPPALGGNYTDAPTAGGEGLALVEGEAPRGRDEVVLDESTAERAGYDLGDRVPLLLPRGQARLTPTVVGLLGFPEGGSLNGATLVLFETPVAQDLFLDGEDAYSDAWITAEDGVSQEELRDAVAAGLPDDVDAVTGDDAADEQASDLLEAISFLTTFLLIFAGIALVVGSFLIVNTFSILVAQRSRELALLRALGASRRQVVRSVQLEAFVLGVLGATLGLGMGVLLALALRALFAQFGLDLSGQPLVFAPKTVLAAYAVGIVVTMAAAWLPSRRSARIAPVQAMRDDIALPESSMRKRFRNGLVLAVLGGVSLFLGLGDLVAWHNGWLTGAGILAILLGVAAMSPVLSRPFLAAAAGLYRRGFGPIGNLAGQNSLRNPRRTTATASALMIGLTLACAMAIIGDSAKASVDKSVEENFVGDYVVSNVFGGEFNPAIAEEMAQVDGVATVLRQRFQFVEYDGDDTQSVAAVDPAEVGLLELRADAGAVGDLADGTVLVDASFADDHDLSVGDELEVGVPSGEGVVVGGGGLRGQPRGLLADRHHPRHLHRGRVRACRQRAHRGRRARRRGRAAAAGGGGRRPADRHREGPAGVRAGAAGADRPVRAHHLRAARAGPADRGPRHRQHARAVDHRAHPRGRAAARRRRHPRAAAADDHAGVGGDRGARRHPRGAARHRLRRGADVRRPRRGARGDQRAVRAGRDLPPAERAHRRPGRRAAGPPGGAPRRPGGDRHRIARC